MENITLRHAPALWYRSGQSQTWDIILENTDSDPIGIEGVFHLTLNEEIIQSTPFVTQAHGEFNENGIAQLNLDDFLPDWVQGSEGDFSLGGVVYYEQIDLEIPFGPIPVFLDNFFTSEEYIPEIPTNTGTPISPTPIGELPPPVGGSAETSTPIEVPTLSPPEIVIPPTDNPASLISAYAIPCGSPSVTDLLETTTDEASFIFAEPVSLHNGEFIRSEQDLYLSGIGFPLTFIRTYRSQINGQSRLGKNWDFSWNKWLEVTPLGLMFHNGFGRSDLFETNPNLAGSYLPPMGYYANLSEVNSGDTKYLLTWANEVKYHFNDLGLLIKIENRFGQTQEFIFNNLVQIEKVKDTRGNLVLLNYSPNSGLLQKITDWTGRSINFTYYQSSELGGLEGTLKSVIATSSDGTTSLSTTYVYDKNNQFPERRMDLIAIYEPGNNQPILQIGYNAEGRVIGQQYENGQFIFDYVQTFQASGLPLMETTAQDRTGKTFIFRMEGAVPLEIETTSDSGQIIKEVFEHDDLANGFYETTKINYPYGDAVSFIYDRQNPNPQFRGRVLEVQRIENPQFGNTILKTEFEWHPQFNLINAVTPPTVFLPNNNLNDFKVSYEYDAIGQLIKVTEPDASVFDRQGNLLGKHQRSKTFEYNGNGQLFRTTDFLGIVNEIIYGNFGVEKDLPVALIYDPTGDNLMTTISYDSLARPIQLNRPNGSIWHIEYNDFNQTTKLLTNDGSEIKYLYDQYGRHTATLTRNLIPDNSNNQPAAADNYMEDTNHPWIRKIFEYNQFGQLTRIGEEISNSVFAYQEFEYDSAGRLYKQIGSEGETSELVLNAFGKVEEVILAKGTVDEIKHTYQYNSFGYRTAYIDPEGHKIKFEHDGFGRITKVENPLQEAITYIYNPLGLVKEVSQLDSAGVKITSLRFFYDELNRPYHIDRLKLDDLGNETGEIFRTARIYDLVTGLLNEESKGSTDPLLSVASIFLTFDQKGRLQSKRDSENNELHYHYNILGQLLSLQEMQVINTPNTPLQPGSITEYDYDLKGRQIRKRHLSPDGLLVTEFIRNYNSRGLSVFEQNPAGHTSKMHYNGLGQLIEIEEHRRLGENALSPVTKILRTQIIYNRSGQQTALIDSNGNITRYHYDGIGRLIKTIYPGGDEVIRTYDKDSKLIEVKDSSGTQINYQYDNGDKLIQKNVVKGLGVEGEDLLYIAWDALGRVRTLETNTSMLEVKYDWLGNLDESEQNGVPVYLQFDHLGRRSTLNAPGGNLIYTKDSLGRNLSIKEQGSANPLVNYDYLGSSLTSKREYNNGFFTAFEYDGLNRMTAISNFMFSGQLFAKRTFQLDNWGRRTAIDFEQNNLPDFQESYEYNSFNALIQVKRTSQNPLPSLRPKSRYHLDGLANRQKVINDGTTTHYQTNSNNQYTQLDNDNFQYDSRGNLISDGQRSFFFDYRNRLVRAIISTGTLEYFYDGLDRMVERFFTPTGMTTATETKRFIYDGPRCIAIQDEYNNLQARFIYGNGINEVICMEKNGQRYFFHHQHLGSISHIADEQGNLVEQYLYHEYGERIILDANGNILTTSAVGNPFGFTGHYFDEELGLYYFRARFYHAQIGRFISRDPIGYLDGMNLYAYVGGIR